MNDIQQKLFDLLTDLDDICTREGIRYYLCEETALAAQVRGNFFKSCLQASVAMTPQDALRFAAAVKKAKRPDRATDSMLNNKHYPNFTMLYSDPNTMMIRLPLHKEAKKPCVGVTIQMIRHQPKRFGAIGNYITKFWKVCCKPAATVGGTFHHTVVAICNGMQRIFGTLLSGTLFRLWGAMYGAGNHSKRISICSDTFQYPAGLVSSTSKVSFEGREFTTFGNIAQYLTVRYGEQYATKTPKFTTASPTLLASANISYDTYVQRLNKEMDMDAVNRTQDEYNKLQKTISSYNRKIERYYAIVARTEKRFALYEQYMPMKEELLKLDQEGRYEELNELLHPYCSALHTFYKKKLGLCFDKEIFDITMNVLEREGRTVYAAKLRAMVPDAHWKPMVITNYKGEPV